MNSIHSTLLFVILCAVRRAVSLPTKAEFCGKPITIDAGLAISDPKNVTSVKRYLFSREHVLPFLWESQQIDWPNVKLITAMFDNSPGQIVGHAGVSYAFAANNQTYLSLKGDERILVFKQSGAKYDYLKSVDLGSVGFEFLVWNISTKSAANTLGTKQMYFFDSTPLKDGNYSKLEMSLKYTRGGIKFEYNSVMPTERLKSFPEVFPNTLIYENSVQKKIKIPIEFDAYYQTKTKEIVFFKGEAACVSKPEPQSPNESQYCHTFVDVRTLIGCTTGDGKVGSGPEVFAEEPEDNDPDF